MTRPDHRRAPPRPAGGRLAAAAAAGLVALAPALAGASYPAGVWARVNAVTPGGDINNPTVRIDGLFIVGNQLPDFPDYPGYGAPKYGYMYYQCPKGQEKVCSMEWADLAAAAGTEDNCRGWGDLSLDDNGSVRESDPMSSPDAYPIAGGVYTGFSPCEALTAWMQENPDTTTTGDASTGDASTGDASTGDASTGDASTGDASTGGTGDTSGTSATGGTGDTSGTGGTSESTTGTGDTAGTSVTGATSGSGDTVGSGGVGEASTGASASGGGEESKDSGCACRSDGDAGPVGLFSALLGLGLLGGRRRRA